MNHVVCTSRLNRKDSSRFPSHLPSASTTHQGRRAEAEIELGCGRSSSVRCRGGGRARLTPATRTSVPPVGAAARSPVPGRRRSSSARSSARSSPDGRPRWWTTSAASRSMGRKIKREAKDRKGDAYSFFKGF